MSTPPAPSPHASPAPTSARATTVASQPAPSDAAAASTGAAFAIMAAALLALAWRLGWFRRGVARWSPPRCPTPASAARLWVGLGAMVMTFAIAATLFAGRPADAGPPTVGRAAGALAAMTAVYCVGLAILAAVHGAMGVAPAAAAIGLRRPTWGERGVVAVAAPFAFCATMAAAAVTQIAWTRIGYRHESAHPLLQVMRLVRESPVVFGVAILNAAVLAPLFEELLFRGHLQTALTCIVPRRWPAILIASVLFALMHDRWMMPPIFVLSLIVGYVYERTGNLWVAVAVHATFNATSTALFLVSRGMT